MKEYTYNSATDWLIFLYLFSPPLSPMLGGGTSSFIKSKIPNKVYGKNVPPILPQPFDIQQQIVFKFLLCRLDSKHFQIWIRGSG